MKRDYFPFGFMTRMNNLEFIERKETEIAEASTCLVLGEACSFNRKYLIRCNVTPLFSLYTDIWRPL